MKARKESGRNLLVRFRREGDAASQTRTTSATFGPLGFRRTGAASKVTVISRPRFLWRLLCLEHFQSSPIRRRGFTGCPRHASLLSQSDGGTDGAAHSQDLRDRVIEAGLSARAAAERFGIGIATAIVWVRRAREGECNARRQGQPRRSKLDPHRAFLVGLIEAKSDITLSEMQKRLEAEAGVTASIGTLWTFLDRCGLTFKKRPRTRASRIAPTS